MPWILEEIDGMTLQVDFRPLTEEDISSFLIESGWEQEFDWSIYLEDDSTFKAFKLIDSTNNIHGCIAYREDFDNLFVEVALVEKAPIHRRQKLYINVGKVLLAYAYKISFDSNFDGYVVLTPKTKRKLIEYYINVYQAQFIGNVDHHPRYLLHPSVGIL